ncbi:hypothetical protein TBLA_0E03450 [Henningerozyma blattae CBS 6284]|uniref:Uncharacterized protein n=1 Tax=Henningerozyma blattae (strain ATCC 34711 / CBS 6284 / DSM 70876 / NBRC 10599 / NRRL Y-10934 / UCD 77-7) TaxID=1071380 RepID=I2H4U8_HENB6|nr:hypothetical protein TBLA_0E03450 [Tetrapisispora blattae CBS 6284]CCH61400.1 hypothetical protein TBLA_0E03450 [Tetrapisispora blattae CBS 6284]
MSSNTQIDDSFVIIDIDEQQRVIDSINTYNLRESDIVNDNQSLNVALSNGLQSNSTLADVLITESELDCKKTIQKIKENTPKYYPVVRQSTDKQQRITKNDVKRNICDNKTEIDQNENKCNNDFYNKIIPADSNLTLNKIDTNPNAINYDDNIYDDNDFELRQKLKLLEENIDKSVFTTTNNEMIKIKKSVEQFQFVCCVFFEMFLFFTINFSICFSMIYNSNTDVVYSNKFIMSVFSFSLFVDLVNLSCLHHYTNEEIFLNPPISCYRYINSAKLKISEIEYEELDTYGPIAIIVIKILVGLCLMISDNRIIDIKTSSNELYLFALGLLSAFTIYLLDLLFLVYSGFRVIMEQSKHNF